MIITVTLNPAVDHTLFVPKFSAGQVNRATTSRMDAGGKGINVSKALKELGAESIACGLIAGRHGRSIKEALNAAAIQYDFVEVPGETRVNIKIIAEDGIHTDINEPGFDISEADFERLKDRVCRNTRHDSIVVLSGSVPPNLAMSSYETLCKKIVEREGVRLIVDSDAKHLQASLSAKPAMLKPNLRELTGYLGYEPQTPAEVVEGARKLIAGGAQTVAVSMGARGAVMVNASRAVLVTPPRVSAIGPVGAGDVMVAALAQSLEEGNDFLTTAKYATAAATASVTIEGTRMASRRKVLAVFQDTDVQEL